jgi:hypothetical protein
MVQLGLKRPGEVGTCRASKLLSETQEPLSGFTTNSKSMQRSSSQAEQVKLLHQKARGIWLQWLAAIYSSNPARPTQQNSAAFTISAVSSPDLSEQHFRDSGHNHGAPPLAAPALCRRRGVRRRPPPRRRGGGVRGRVPGGVRAGAGAVRVALGARGGAAAARAGEREPAAHGARDRGRAPGAARRRRGVAVRLAEGHPHGRQVPAPGLLRRHQLRPRRQPRRARPPRPRRAGARLVRGRGRRPT